jgi:hypothetical protein
MVSSRSSVFPVSAVFLLGALACGSGSAGLTDVFTGQEAEDDSGLVDTVLLDVEIHDAPDATTNESVSWDVITDASTEVGGEVIADVTTETIVDSVVEAFDSFVDVLPVDAPEDVCADLPLTDVLCPSGNGMYCGEGVNQTAGVLYECTNGTYTVSQTCTDGCHQSAAGVDDYCNSGSSCPSGNGYYCENDGMRLDYCSGGSYSFSAYCLAGCHAAPAGTDDYCNSGSCPSGNGDYCGSQFGLTSSILFTCSAGKLTIKSSCADGCHQAAAGQNDYCN